MKNGHKPCLVYYGTASLILVHLGPFPFIVGDFMATPIKHVEIRISFLGG